MEIFTEEYEFNPEKKYIHYFDDVIDYQKYAGSERYAEPHVSVHFEEEGEDAPVLLRYNKDVRKEFERYRSPLTFEVLSAGTLYFTNANDNYKNRRNLMYKVNDEDWVTIESGITKQYFGIPEEPVPFDPSSVTSLIEDIGTYGFVLCASTGYYTSTNIGVNSSAAVSRITFNTLTPCNVVFNYINYAEGNYDYGVFGNLDANIGTGTSSNNVYKQATNSSSVQTLTYSVPSPGQHFIEVKFRKDGSASSYNDNLQFNFSFTQYEQTEIQLNVGDVIQVKADNAAYGYSTGTSYYSTFNGTAVVKVSGNIMSLLDSETFSTLFRIDRPYTFYSLFYNYTGLTSDGELVLPATTLANYCYQRMFYGCSKLTIAPDLPSEKLASTCYDAMFSNCTSLTKAPELPATTLVSYCYNGMFSNCTSLTTAPELPATTLASDCYYQMFYGCASLTEAPELPATTLESDCYYQMFYDCASLTEAPELPATTLASNCYNGMFGGCRNLATAPELPATTLTNSCYGNMFYNCYSLIEAPELPATTLAQTCYYNMFSFCTSLTTAPELPATTLASNCYEYMFRGCTRLTTAPELTVTTLTTSCYQSMFYNCTSLTTAPELPATTLVNNCYNSMFYGCTSLTEAPELPATTLASYCYYRMFYNCTSLTTAPELPATTLADYCYNNMFYNCTSLTTAPKLPAPTLVSNCYSSMFYGCTKLNYIKCLATNISASSCLYYWTYNVSPTGTFVKDVNMSGWTRGYNGIPTNWAVEDDYSNTYLIFESIDGGTFKFSGSTTSNTLSYSLDSGQTWVALAHDTETPSLSVGQSIMWKGEATPLTNEGIGTFIADGEYNIKGNVMSLLYGDDFADQDSLEGYDYAFYCLFRGDTSISANTHVINAEHMVLPAKTLSPGCYFSMFSQCRNLLSAPELPAKTMEYACYQSMFYNCESLTEGPELPATVLAERCYRSLFRGCSSLTTSPELPATTLVEQCYQTMFSGCSSLNYIACNATDISATNCTNGWVNGVASSGTFEKNASMDGWTTGVNGIPIGWNAVINTYLTFIAREDFRLSFSAYTLSNFSYSLNNGNTWGKFTSQGLYTPFVHSGETIMTKYSGNGNYSGNREVGFFKTSGSCDVVGNIMSMSHGDGFKKEKTISSAATFSGMFKSTNIVKSDGLLLPATTLTNFCYQNMFSNCTSLTTAPPILPATTLASFCYNSMFSNCTSLTEAPELPATTLAQSCYGFMFDGCNSLTTAPELPATTLVTSCYIAMFRDCTSLTEAPELPATTLASSCYQVMFDGCTSLTEAPELPATTLPSSCYEHMFRDCTSLTTAPSILPATTFNSYSCAYMFENCRNLTTAPSSLGNSATTFGTNSCSYMFYNCTSLTAAPELPATTLASDCYQYMFYNCTSLTAAPSILPATTLASNCYYGMFHSCTSLTTAPELPAPTLVDSCYYYMFYNCSKLNYIKCLTTNISAYHCLYYWTNGVFPIGTFVKNNNMSGWARGSDGIPTNWDVENCETEPLTFEAMGSGNIIWKINNNDYPTTIQYSKNGSEWTNITSTTAGTSISVVSGDTIRFRGDNSTYTKYDINNGYCYNSFKTTCSFKVRGNISSLINSVDYMLTENETLKNSRVFYGLFENCTGMTDASELVLPSKTLRYLCYAYMFDACTNLTKAPKLPATTLAESCYMTMFRSCYSLTVAPLLPAETLFTSCYRAMFYNCTQLTATPELPAKTLAPFCYANMFYGCTSLNEIWCYATDISADSCTVGWVKNVAASGTFYSADNANDWIVDSYDGVPPGWTLQTPRNTYVTFKVLSGGNIVWTSYASDYYTANFTIEYSKNDGPWSSITSITGSSAPTFSVVSGDKVQFRGNNSQYGTSWSRYATFSGTSCTFNLYGNLMSLNNASDFSGLTSVYPYAFMGLFSSTTGLNDASQFVLPATNLSTQSYKNMFARCVKLRRSPEILPSTAVSYQTYCSMFSGCYSLTSVPVLLFTSIGGEQSCYGMFENCYSLTTAPELPATNLSGTNQCYSHMFQGCYSLISAPELPATILSASCYQNMFQDCKSLISGPSILPATVLTNQCYSQMFQGCTNLTTAPELPATTLESYCYSSMFYNCAKLNIAPELPATALTQYCYSNMFKGCTSLPEAPELPATKLAFHCYDNMFSGCTNLTTAPELPATNLSGANYCYQSMFSNCTNLVEAPELPATTLESYCYAYMFENCPNLKYGPSILPATTTAWMGYYCMFSNCSSLISAPELPATTLTGYCYGFMFQNCTSLVTAPELPSLTLATDCYNSLFRGCTKLNYIKCLATDISASNCLLNWAFNVSSTGTFVKNPSMSMSSWSSGGNGIPNNWTVQDAT